MYAARDMQTGGLVALKVVACGGPKQVPISVVRREVGDAAPAAARRRTPCLPLYSTHSPPAVHTCARAPSDSGPPKLALPTAKCVDRHNGGSRGGGRRKGVWFGSISRAAASSLHQPKQ